MTFLDEGVEILRVLLGDLGPTPEFTDSRLERLLFVAALQVDNEVHLRHKYTIKPSYQTIEPDPLSLDDFAFLNLTCLKAACIADVSKLRTEAMRAGIRAKLGPALLDTDKRTDGFNILLSKGPCAAYEEAVTQWKFSNFNFARVILSPFVSNTFDPENLSRSKTHRGGDSPYNVTNRMFN